MAMIWSLFLTPAALAGETLVLCWHDQQEEGEGEMHERSGRQHDRPLPARLPAERARLIAGIDILQRRHAGDLHEAAERERLDAVLGLAPRRRPQRLPEADEEPGDLHVDLLGGHELAH